MPHFAIHPDSPLIERREPLDQFSWRQATIIVGMHLLALPAVLYMTTDAMIAFVVAHCLCLGGGVAVGYHRLLAHRSYRAPTWFMRLVAGLGTLAFQVGPLLWAAIHRAHHAHTDEEQDAHASVRGFWWSHIGWTFYRRPNGFEFVRSRKLIRDLANDPVLRFLDRHMILVNVIAVAIVSAIARDIAILLWAFPLRIVVGWHLTWLINSYAHRAPLIGTKRRPDIRNSALLAALAFGEGWHGNHHLYPGRANFAVAKLQIDPAYVALRLLHALGIVELRREPRTRCQMENQECP